MPDVPFAGEILGMDDATYHAQDWACGSTWLKTAIAASPYHASAKTEAKNDAALVVGTVLHAMVLEPDSVVRKFMQCPELDRRTKAGKATYEGLQATSSLMGQTLVQAQEWELAKQMATSIRRHGDAYGTLLECKLKEVSYFAEVRDGIWGKARFDAIALDGRIACDVKTVSCRVTDYELSSAARSWGWPIQCAWYNRVREAAGLPPIGEWRFICVEKTDPHAVRVVVMPDDAIEAAYGAIDVVLTDWHLGTNAGFNGISTLDIPSFYTDRLRRIGGGA
jgi:hypothetical protein